MFDISFTELLLCFVIALLVLGPERLPGAARSVGRWTGQARAYLRNLTSELDRETRVAELKKQLEDANRALREGTQSVKDAAQKLVSDSTKPPPPP